MGMSRYSTCVAFTTMLVFSIAHSVTGMASQPLRAVSAASAPAFLLTEDLLNRMIAVTRELQKVDSDDSDDEETPSSTEAIGDRLDVNPATHALLKRYGLTGRSYIRALKTLSRAGGVARMAGTQWASRMPGSAAVDPRNVTFYHGHKAGILKLAALQNPDTSPAEDERLANSLRSLDPDDLADCVLLAPSIASLTPHLLTGPVPMPPASRLKLADATEQFVANFKSLRMKKDFSILAGEIRRHQNIVREAPASFLAALDDVSSWGETHCQCAGREP